jgi:hypothetical protein
VPPYAGNGHVWPARKRSGRRPRGGPPRSRVTGKLNASGPSDPEDQPEVGRCARALSTTEAISPEVGREG